MKNLLISLCLLIFCPFSLWGYHIVGGEMELVHIEGYQYYLNLIQYFDKSQSSNPGPDLSVQVYIYRNSDHSFIRSEILEITTEADVPYSNPDCAIGSLQTSRVFYSAEITLEPSIFNESEGYYAVWERCCRNTALSNIVNPGGQGMTYALDFPAVIKNGKPFVNSSPQLFPPLSDYACVNQTYYTNFAGTDPDGDSIVYSLQLPYNSTSQVALPIPQPKPFVELFYANGSDLNNIIPGAPSLNITPNGFLTVNPSNTGLYVFSVLVEEYRNSEKIGELRRDFQMLVVDGCDPPTPPKAQVKLPGSSGFYKEGDIINYSASEEKCFEYLVVDNAGENVTLKAEGVNFNADVSDIFDFTSKPINASGDTLKVEVCISDCPYVQNEPYIIDLIASDDACPLPQRDTVQMTINVEPPPNNSPYYLSPDANNIQVRSRAEGISVALDELLIGVDDDPFDSLRFFFYAEDFNPIDYGMSLDTIKDELGRKEVKFKWNTDCKAYPFGDKNTFDLGIVLEDYDTCAFDSGDTLFYELEVVLPPNTPPTISGPESFYENIIKSTRSFDVKANDPDGDRVEIIGVGEGFLFENVGISFESMSDLRDVESSFEWQLSCENLNIKSTTIYQLYFIAEDTDYCKETNADTIAVEVKVVVPPNTKPEFLVEDYYALNINEEFVLDIVAQDGDNTDLLTLGLLSVNSAPASDGFSFEEATGINTVSSTLRWTPECELLGEDYASEIYPVDFLVFDDNCPNIQSETLTINFEISELTVDYGVFTPPNAFSPNGDGYNDTYTLNNLDEEFYNLPPDNCDDQFQSIVIFDRAGGKVFQSSDRDFIWTGQGASIGTYFFYIEYLHSSFKGFITLIR